MWYNNGSKYKAKKVKCDGHTFDSQKEYNRYCELKFLEKQGVIKDLKCQVKYVLIPTQRDKSGKLLEREKSYYADFCYYLKGELVVEDVKGFKTEAYKLKRALMLWIHGIKILET